MFALTKSARALRTLASRCSSAGEIRALPLAEAIRLAGEPEEAVAPLLIPLAPGVLEAQRSRMEAAGARLVTRFDAEYPQLLAQIPDAPFALFARGRPLVDAPAVAVVGARRASRHGLEAARLIARALAEAGVAVVSGFARGVDAASHRAALDGGGFTLAVFGCGVDVLYPSEHRALLADLLFSGTAVSELPMGTRPQPFQFPVRNRIIAGLSRVTVVVEAAEKSGSLITARCAAEYGRDVGAVPGPVVVPGAAGSNALLKDGAIFVRSAEDVLAELPEEDLRRLRPRSARASAGASSTSAASAGPDEAALLSALDPDEPRDADALASATGLSAARLSSALVRLELDGLLESLPGALFVRRR